MRLLFAVLVGLAPAVMAAPASAGQDLPREPSTCVEAWRAAKASGSQESEAAYVHACENGRSNVTAQTSFPPVPLHDLEAPAPMAPPASSQVPGQPPPNATAICKDGAYSTVPGREGVCEGHGGVTQYFK